MNNFQSLDQSIADKLISTAYDVAKAVLSPIDFNSREILTNESNQC